MDGNRERLEFFRARTAECERLADSMNYEHGGMMEYARRWRLMAEELEFSDVGLAAPRVGMMRMRECPKQTNAT
jgi:hypothetical protein